MILATNGSGLRISSDGGESWTYRNPYDDWIHWVLSTGSALWTAQHGGVSKSTDGGENWTTYFMSGGETSRCIAHDPSIDRIYVSSDGRKISWTDDAGANWTTAILGTSDHGASSSKVVVSRGVVYVTSDGQGLHVSTDNGENWVKQNTPSRYIKGIIVIND
jgi:photosystem II stability/assembly factor-like uncharacterized protein